jgi:EpsD family peptidyl-prolyl cis-trans isomerase
MDAECLSPPKERLLRPHPTLNAITLMVLASSLALTGCGPKDKTQDQAVARVNGEEVTLYQVDTELAQMNVQPSLHEQAGKQVLQDLIDRRLLQTAALKAKLDHDSETQTAIDRAKAQILAQAYLRSVTASQPEPTEDEIHDYFIMHPEYFRHRKIFALNEIVLPGRDLSDEARAAFYNAGNLNEVGNWLVQHDVRFERLFAERSTSDLPTDLTSQLLRTPVGGLTMIRMPDMVMLASVQSVSDDPIDETQARPQIKRYLLNAKRKQAQLVEIERLRKLARIEYLDADPPAEKSVTEEKTVPFTSTRLSQSADNRFGRDIVTNKSNAVTTKNSAWRLP